MDTIKLFKYLKWYRINVIFKNNNQGPLLVTVLQAILKGAYLEAFPNFDWQGAKCANLIFHVKNNRKFNQKLRKSEEFEIDIILTDHSHQQAQKYIKSLTNWMKDKDHAKYYSLKQIVNLEERSYPALANEYKDIKHEGEVCLEFINPYSKKIYEGKDRTYIPKKKFIKDFEKRFSRLFDIEIKYNSAGDDFDIIPYYWHYTELAKYRSGSGKGNFLINGFAGNFYLKGEYKNFLPFLILGSELHAGNRISYALGYYRLHLQSKPFFNKFFPSKKYLVTAVYDVIEDFDSTLDEVKEFGYGFKPWRLANKLYKRIKNDNFTFSSNKMFKSKKKGGGYRKIEELHARDLIVNKYLLLTISKIFDRILEEESVGFRKGVSREKAIKLVKSAIKKGYNFVLETDIKNFFSSINLDKMEEILDFYIPEKDRLLKKIIKKSIRAGYTKKGKEKVRKKGLAQGNPISPMLANIYLDDFDEYIKQHEYRLVRYGDDFLILTKTKKEAENILTRSQTYLDKWDLKLNKDKTKIKSVYDGFSFLGTDFKGIDQKFDYKDVAKMYKKPLYITEPNLFLSINGDVLHIKRKYKTILTLPFRRISNIIISNRVLFTNSFVRRCMDFDIPVTFTLNTGYFVTTIKPDSKRYFDLAFQHKQKFNQLSSGEKLEYARKIVAKKFDGYQKLFKDRYVKGNNEIINHLKSKLDSINNITSVDELRGVEGGVAKKIYGRLNTLIKNDHFYIDKRVRSKPDRINSLLNFGYYLLFSRINTVLRSLGLNPYLGFLHSSKNNYESLVTDLQEPIRAKIDRFIIKYINLGMVHRRDFNRTKRGMYLKYDAQKKYINNFEGFIKKRKKKKSSINDKIYIQSMVIKRWISKGDELLIID